MDQKQEFRIETKLALAQLRRYTRSVDVDRACAAKNVLYDKELLIRYVEKRLIRKRKAETKAMFLTKLKKLTKLFRPREWRHS